jgi:hypothetical protein
LRESKTNLPKALQKLLDGPIHNKTKFGSLQTETNTGEISQQFGQAPQSRLHKRQTLQTGQPHWHSREKNISRHLFIAIDPHPSVSHLIPKDQQDILILFLQKWGQRQGLQVKILEGVSSHGWGPELTKTWLQQLSSYRDGHLFILSDFHGPDFFSDSLQRLIHHFDTRFIRISHDRPNHKEKVYLRAMNNHPHGIHLFDPSDFEKKFNAWNQQVHSALRKTRVPYIETSDMNIVHLVKSILNMS